ncbi:spore coat associated protein CotJA [Paenibacillus sp. FSL R10-2734]|uniref:spore coat associated protein CotJA n=1 Tax=Paenibacillus sp. FSL R10-2734 TaxID=2954691 RepID=UPI0030DC3F17
MESQLRSYTPFRGPFDPCPPVPFKTYVVPPNQFINFQPPDLPQFSLQEALRHGTLWPALFSPYESKCKGGGK